MVNYPTGCESVSTVMALNYVGINTSVDTFIDNYLDKSGVPFDPNKSFGGNPRSTSGYGCYSPVIKEALDDLLPGKGYHVKELKDVSLQSLCTEYIDNNIPVVMWATLNMTTPKIRSSWLYGGKTIQWISPEHCLLLVGYDENNYIFNDPQKTKSMTYYSKASVEAAYSGLSCQAIVILPGDAILADSISVSPSNISSTENFRVDQTRQLTATVYPTNSTEKNITWLTDNPTVATVSNTGLVTAESVGIANITAKIGDYSAKCSVTVRHSEPFHPTRLPKRICCLPHWYKFSPHHLSQVQPEHTPIWNISRLLPLIMPLQISTTQ